MIRKIFFLVISISLLLSWKNKTAYIIAEKTKIISIGIGDIKVPDSWKSVSYNNYQFLISGKDTLKFGTFLIKRLPLMKVEYSPVIKRVHTDSGDIYVDDTTYNAANRIIKAYNDTLKKNYPEVLTHCYEFFMAADSSFQLSCILPCHTEAGWVYVDISAESGDNSVSMGMESTIVSPAKAKKIIAVLKTFRSRK